MRLADVNDELTRWALRPAPKSGSFLDSGKGSRFNGLRGLDPNDVFDELDPNDVFDDVGPEQLCGLDDLTLGELVQLGEFDGFWSSITSGIKKVAKVVQEKGVPVLKYGIPGVKKLGAEIAKVGAFVVKQPLLQKALESAIPVIGPLVSGPMLEIAASMVEQQGKKNLVQAGQAPTVANLVARVDARTPARTDASPRKAVLPAAATVGFSPLPAAGVKKVDFVAALAQMQRLSPVAQKVAQRFVRAGVPAATAVQVVSSVDFDKAGAAQNAAYIGSLKLAQQQAKSPF